MGCGAPRCIPATARRRHASIRRYYGLVITINTGQGIGLSAADREKLHLAGIPVPSWIGHVAGLWDDLARMESYLDARPPLPPHVLLAASRFSDGKSVSVDCPQTLALVNPSSRDTHWRPVGFDVADESLVSGLSNCGYAPLEAAALREKWEQYLNESHLFEDVGRALQFRAVVDRRVPEHAPFYVYGLFIVREAR